MYSIDFFLINITFLIPFFKLLFGRKVIFYDIIGTFFFFFWTFKLYFYYFKEIKSGSLLKFIML